MRPIRLILASASPRRAALLRSVGWEFDVRPADVDEMPRPGEHPDRTVLRLARAKATSVAPGEAQPGDVAVLGADTAVVLDGQALGKPGDAGEARRMLLRLSGRTHRVCTGVCLSVPATGVTAEVIETTEVVFRSLEPEWIDWYVGTGEPLDKAGAYGIQERGVWLTRRIHGSWSNVVGLPLERLPELLVAIGADARAPVSR